MNETVLAQHAAHTPPHSGTVLSYTIGFVGSLLCTFFAYAIVAWNLPVPLSAVGIVVALAIIQFVIQLMLFLHIGRKTPTWRMAALAFAFITVVILVVGSLWIMYNLNRRMMMPEEQMQYMLQDAG